MVLFGETLSTLTWVGIGVVIVGVVLVQTGTPPSGRRPGEYRRRERVASSWSGCLPP